MTTRTRPVRMLYVGGFDFPTPYARAIQSLHTAHALARAGWIVSLVVQRPKEGRDVDLVAGLAAYGLQPHPNLSVTSLSVVRPRPVPGLDIHTRLAITNWTYGAGCLLRAARGRFDVVFTRDPRLAWLFLQTRSIHRCPVVYEVHELFATRPRDNVSLAPGDIWGVAQRTRALERSVVAGADLLLPLTRACAGLIAQAYGGSTTRMAVTPDGTIRPPAELPPIDRSAPRVVYAGQLYAWKGVDTLLRALAPLDDARLRIIGGLGPHDPSMAELHRLVDDLGIRSRVELTGFVPHVQVRSLLTGASAGAVPLPDRLMSRYFTSPLKVFDYMAAGVPVVASDLPALREVLADAENALLTPPDDPAALSAALRRLLDDRGLAERLRTRAFEQVHSYTWERRAERIIEAVSPLVG